MQEDKINQARPNSGEKRQYKTDGGKTKSNAIEIPSISLPKGGGAIKGIDQKFTVNAVNGTAAFSVPVPVSAARGAVPTLSLSYNSGSGNSIFGLGWSINLPSIKRKTDKELPQYNDYIDSDTYLLAEAEDLVPEYERNVNGTFKKVSNKFVILENTSISGWTIRYYKPRIEGIFARIERWKENTTGEIKWRVISRENTITLYGWNSDGRSRKTDPENSLKIFEWLPEYVIDDKGNCAYYEYAIENDEGFDDSKPHNRNRKITGNITYTNQYLVRVRYGNKNPIIFTDVNDSLGDDSDFLNDFMFETALDYGQYDIDPPFTLNSVWDFRSDPFSEYKSGFEIRTTRLCKRVLLFHHFPDINEDEEELHTYLVGGHALVKSLDFIYDNNGTSGFQFLRSITSKGYVTYLAGVSPTQTVEYSSKSLPPMVFEYQEYGPNTIVKEIDPENVVNAPTGLSKGYQFTDLYNEGLPGILTEQGGGWYYKSNFGDGKFSVARMVSPKPSFNGLNNNLQLIDLEGDGQKQVVNFSDSPQGYFEITDDPNETNGAGHQWRPFRYFRNLPNINLKDADVRLIDLNGDGKTDILITEDQVFTWYESEGKDGFSERYRTPQFVNEEDGPKVIFAETTQTIHLADMSGDGLVDIVRIRNGEVCYWPNLGFGRFGKKVVMDNAPVMDGDIEFNPRYIKLADIDGSGTPDLIYLGKNKFSYWRNFNGNNYSSEIEISGFPSIHPDAEITVTDLLGTGLSCVVWSSSLQKDAQAPLRYIDLMDGKKPHIMKKWRNSLGKEVELEYSPSTKFYIEDKLKGMPWITRLHFPVHCLSKVINTDKVTGHSFTSTYSYHHGYFDHSEKEFRGFGRVDQIDIEITEHYENDGGTLEDISLDQAPVLTRSWFHTGAYIRDKKILNQFANEYWYNVYNKNALEQSPPLSTIATVESELPEARIISDKLHQDNEDYVQNEMKLIEKRQAYRACKSLPLRVEVFALDAPDQDDKDSAEYLLQLTPFMVSTHNCMIELLQPIGENKHAIFCVKESEAITFHYERENILDPRIAHTFNLEMDIYGNVLKSASVVYSRLIPITIPSTPPIAVSAFTMLQAAQAKTAIVFNTNNFTNDISLANEYRLRAPAESKTYEVTKLTKTTSVPASPKVHLYTIEDFEDLLSEVEIPYEQTTPSATVTNIRLIEHLTSLYYNNNLTSPLTLGTLHSKGIPYESYQLAYTENPGSTNFDLLEDIFGGLVLGTDMLQGQFEQIGNNWWIRSGVIDYIDAGASETVADAEARFYLPIVYTNQYGSETLVNYDNFLLLPIEIEDAVGNIITVEVIDYRTLNPVEMKDPNNNLSRVILDELGLPKALAQYDKSTAINDLTGITAQTSEQSTINSYFSAANAAVTDANVVTNGALQTHAKSLLQHASARYVYDFNCYTNDLYEKPAVVSSILREEHYTVNNASPLQISFEYNNGSGQVVMKKIQAEPGLADQVTVTGTSVAITSVDTTTYNPDRLRWIGNGRTIYNNKGKPVKQYEPFFSTTAGFEDSQEMVEHGVTPLIYYDSMSRAVRTLFPDKSFSKVEYYGWKQVTFDPNDTCGDDTEWFLEMDGGTADEKDAAGKTFAHFNTPKIVHFDTLGRPILEEESDGSSIIYTQLHLDIEGNLRKVTDSRGIDTMQYKYDMLGLMVYQFSADSGQRWLLHDCMGSPLRTWDERNFEIQFEYDGLHRPLTVKVLNGDGSTMLNNVVDFYEYGEGVSGDQSKNLRGNLYRHWDSGGLQETPEYYFFNKPKQTERWLAGDYKSVVDWTTVPTFPLSPSDPLELNSYVYSEEFDALGRIKKQTTPDNRIILPTYNERGILISETVTEGPPTVTTQYLVDVKYDAKGQRKFIEYGNGVTTTYTFDDKTFRLKRLLTQKSGSPLQDLNYTYDAVGNITRIEDVAISPVFFSNSQIDPVYDYTYDALYRLTTAMGREMNAIANFNTFDNYDDAPFITTSSGGSSVELQNYTQEYVYDSVGNIKDLIHTGENVGSYHRVYTYSGTNNRLTQTTVGGSTYNYNYHNEHGFLIDMPHLPRMGWNFKEELVLTSKQAISGGTIPETTYYQYDSRGVRLRKITENPSPGPPPAVKNMRIYIDGYEYYQSYGAGASITETVSLLDEGHRFVMIENSSTQGSLVRYNHPNSQSSCVLETDNDGDVINYEEYHPFGTTSYYSKDPLIAASYKRYRYTGMERDEETGLNYHNARYYIPWLCKWLSPDPIGIADGVNVYSYCQNNPVVSIDTSGTQSRLPFLTKQLVLEKDHARVQPKIDAKTLIISGQRQALEKEKAKETAKLLKAFSETYNANNPGFAEQAKATLAKQQKKSEQTTRVSGFFQMIGGTFEAAIGGVGGVVSSETGVGAVVGWSILVHGSDNMVAGFNKMVTGSEYKTQTEQFISEEIQKLGVDKETSDKFGSTVNVLIGIAGSGNLASEADAFVISLTPASKIVIIDLNEVLGLAKVSQRNFSGAAKVTREFATKIDEAFVTDLKFKGLTKEALEKYKGQLDVAIQQFKATGKNYEVQEARLETINKVLGLWGQ